ncbi:MAG: hypothetical protein RRB13_06225 [bacterium]|nr:hypothetical protein [bacterium]
MRLVALLCLALWFPLLSQAQAIKSYQVETQVEVLDRDVVYARNRAFSALREQVVHQAIFSLLGEPMYKEFIDSRLAGRRIRPDRYINAVKVLEEKRQGDAFFMKIEGKVEMEPLADQLRKMHLVLASDPWQKVSLVVETPLQVPLEALRERLKIFHLELLGPHQAQLPEGPHDQPDFVQPLFEAYNGAPVIFLIEARRAKEGELFDQVGLRIYRQAGYAQLGSFSMGIDPVAADDLDDALEDRQKSFLALFSVSSLKVGSFEEGQKSMVYLEVEGLDSPYHRSQFENRILRPSSAVGGYWLTGLGRDKSEYMVQAKRGMKRLVAALAQPSPYFSFELEEPGINRLRIKAAFKPKRSLLELKPFEPQPDLIKEIAEMLELPEGQLPTLEQLPKWSETEPNNNAYELNNLGPKHLVYGMVTSRADEDLFLIQPKVGAKMLVIEWGRVGKTDLSPQIKLYDQEVEYLNQYNLIGTRRTEIRYNFRESPQGPVYLRVADRVGFIQGETGGFKNFRYLIRYYWK